MVSANCKDKLLPVSEKILTKAELENFLVMRNITVKCWFVEKETFLRNISALLKLWLGKASHRGLGLQESVPEKRGRMKWGNTYIWVYWIRPKILFSARLELDSYGKNLRTEDVYGDPLHNPHWKSMGREGSWAHSSQAAAQWWGLSLQVPSPASDQV